MDVSPLIAYDYELMHQVHIFQMLEKIPEARNDKRNWQRCEVDKNRVNFQVSILCTPRGRHHTMLFVSE